MAIKSDDSDIRPALFNVELGGNGDYYLTTVEQQDHFTSNGELETINVLTSVRIAMSGGNAPHEVKMAVGQLYKALEQHGMNLHPLHQLYPDKQQ